MRYHPFAHIGLKIVSAALAVLLWVMVTTQQSSVERGLRIPLELQNLPANLEMVDAPQDSVDVRVRGAADALGRLAPGDVVATIDLSAAQAGRRLFHISPDRVKAPFAVDVMQVTPASVVIRFEPSATRLVPVHPSTEGETAPGFIVGEVIPDPKTVEIVGPESTLRHVTEVITEPVWVGGAKVPIRATVPLGVADPNVRLKTVRNAIVRVDVVQAPAERQLTVPVRLRNLSSGLSAAVEPRVVGVRARGAKAAIDRLRDSSVVAYVDVDGVGEGDFGLPVRLEPIAGIGLDQLDPTVVHIHIK